MIIAFHLHDDLHGHFISAVPLTKQALLETAWSMHTIEWTTIDISKSTLIPFYQMQWAIPPEWATHGDGGLREPAS